MAFTDPFIRRPVLATVVSLLIILLGFQAFGKLVIRQYPQMENALITVTTAYPGANAETIQGYITQPLQQSLASAEGIDYMTSSSQQNFSTISIYARIGADTDRLFTELLAKANEVKNQLPQDAEDPVLSKEAADASALMYVSFYSDQLSNPQITDYLSRVIQPKLATLPGMAEAEILGNQVFAMRLWLDPVKMAAYGIAATDVTSAVQRYNFLAAAGEVKGQYVVTSINATTDLKSAEAFGAIPVKTDGDSRVLVRDIARVEMGAANYDSISSFDGIPSVYIAIKGTPSANPLDVIKHVRAALPELEAQLPPNLKVSIAYDATEFIRASIDEVVKTLAEAVLIVIVVVFLFLGAFRSVLIPVITIPLSMIGVLFFMQLMGYSINLLTLLAMVLAIGLVVDDAIVVVENIHRHIEEGKTPFDAAIEGAREIAVPVISMTITLAAVYAPIGFLEGLTGALFKEFALTLAGAVIISGIVALTLSPMMCAKLLRHEENPSGLAHKLDQIFDRLKRRYQKALHGTLNTRPVVVVFAVIVLCLIPVLLMFSKSELAPEEDQGIVFLFANAPQPTNLDYMNAYTDQFVKIFKEFPEYYSSFQINGFDGVQAGIGGFLLKPWDERERTQMELLPIVQGRLNDIPGLQIFGFNLPSLPGTGQGLPFQFVINTPNDYESLLQVAERVKQKAMESGQFAFLNVDLAFDKPEVVVDIDREKAAQMGVSMQDLGATLAILLGEGEVNRFTIDGRSYKVIAQVERAYRDNPGWLSNYYVKSESGQMVPLGTLIKVSDRARPTKLKQFQQLNAAIIEGVPIVSMGEAVDTVAQIAREEAPRGYTFDYAGASRQYIQEGSALYATFGLALAIIFLVLAAQFESFRDPLVILVTVPLSICGALIPIFLGLSSMNIYTQVGLVTLIGLISKHGILIVEFANQLRREKGLSIREAIEEAASIRLRPVLMTTAAMVFGMVPLILATGAGAVSRFDIGLVIATGMSIGTLFTLFVLPCVYTLLASPDKAPKPAGVAAH
ncbi:multidrug efflux RND transporter permease subunit [Aquipseudomonas alcaligenes]|uniref:MexW/MexI family multidrug efflux RND transporter permease subunit n=1 Tax=Aquipseudomonas alcaligenes TaxID=43263 RepID=A0AA37CCV3_AQUAC|nr:multidrug efflux RND transporter permease subunit [Pseudomonas alcaligenes]BCR23542.1 MexW/MexI family multidrug efflux RND transporter permease subunit [Pseudomonas alcaligenes]GIZ64993.1 MexW/MexI family multidrug efflux RND transporter permease subunit [Pseudomonas alcaligenes]GIZ69682.1 MexW/MexI family multidrug efflux RND transporter permease subunit [Pseudomonas alcaligenes]GIZ74034.1 MexW/MexI family multidrug efflux RND transporter permease subunit [Pseudomonas alcaligenes]GIZ78395